MSCFSCSSVDGDLYGFYDPKYNAHVVKQYKKGWGLIVGGMEESKEVSVHIYFDTFSDLLMWVCDEWDLWEGT